MKDKGGRQVPNCVPNESVVNEEALPKDGSTIKVSNIPVKIEYVSNKKYIGYSWKDKNNKEHYEETKTSDHSNLNSLIKTIKINLDESINEAPNKLKHTISKKEWSKIPKYNKHIGMDGVHYIMKYDDKIGTYLQGVQIVDESVNEANKSGDKLTHKHNPNIEIELIEPTNKGWKVYQIEKGKKKIAYFDKQDISGDRALFESVNEASNTGEKIQNLNNRIKVLRDKISATKSPEQKKLHSDRLKNALQSLSNIKKDFGIKKESSHNLGKVQYTDKNMTPTQILDLSMAYVQTPITNIVGNKSEHRVRAANDLAKLTGTTQLDVKTRGKQPALILFLLKNKLVSKEEYTKLYKDLLAKQIQVIKYLKNSSPEMRNSSIAMRAAEKDGKSEFDI
jgi:hypothetical protein